MAVSGPNYCIWTCTHYLARLPGQPDALLPGDTKQAEEGNLQLPRSYNDKSLNDEKCSQHYSTTSWMYRPVL